MHEQCSCKVHGPCSPCALIIFSTLCWSTCVSPGLRGGNGGSSGSGLGFEGSKGARVSLGVRVLGVAFALPLPLSLCWTGGGSSSIISSTSSSSVTYSSSKSGSLDGAASWLMVVICGMSRSILDVVLGVRRGGIRRILDMLRGVLVDRVEAEIGPRGVHAPRQYWVGGLKRGERLERWRCVRKSTRLKISRRGQHHNAPTTS